MPRIKPSWLLILVLNLALGTRAASAQTCAQGQDTRFMFPFFANAGMNINQVTLYGNSAAQASATLLAAVQAGVAAWNQNCPNSTYRNIPTFAVNWTAPRPFPPGSDEQVRKTIIVDFRPNEAARQVPGTNRYEFAVWTGGVDTNLITVFGRCPTGAQLPDLGCNGTNTPINWDTPLGRTALAHEIGHALGLAHDRSQQLTGQACPMSLMNEAPAPGAAFSPAYCGLADRMNDPDAPCNSQQPGAGETNPCEIALRRGGDNPNGDATEGLGNEFCETNPWLCDDGPTSWAGGAPECHWYCSSSLGTQWCDWGCFAPVVATPGATIEVVHAAPVIGLAAPAVNATVTGLITISGWAHEFFHMPTVEFGLNSEAMPVTNLQVGLNAPGACQPPAGIGHSRCNRYTGFSARLETRMLPNGVHKLHVTAVGQNGFPSAVERQVIVSNSCFDYTPPSLAVSAPTYTVAGSVTITANTADDVGVTAVDFSVDGVLKATDTSAPFTYSWDTTPYSNGVHFVEAVAHDGCSNSAYKKVNFTVVKDTSAPQVSLLAPAGGSVVRGTVTLQAQASDAYGIGRVEFFIDGALRGTDTTAPYAYAWSTTGDGPHNLLAKAYDTNGNIGMSPNVSVIVDNTAPGLSVGSPTYNQTISGNSVKVSGWATDGSDTIALSFAMDGQTLPLVGDVAWLARQDVCDNVPAGDSRCPYVGWRGFFDSTRFANGWHTLDVSATDAAGWVISSRINVYVSNAVSSIVSRFGPSEDAWVRALFPSNNYGTTTNLGVRSSWFTNDGGFSFLKFNVSGVSGTVVSAKLLLRTLPSPLTELYVYRVANTWTETGITWANMPLSSAVDLTHRFNLAGSTWYDFEATSYVTGNGVFSFGIATADTASNLGCSSRETSYAPVLEITYRP
jgi:hypothetical protein